MLLKENEMNNVLIGAADEITDSSHDILTRFGLYKDDINSNDLYNSNSKGHCCRGRRFFLSSNQSAFRKKCSKAWSATEFFYQPENKEVIEKKIASFLATQSLAIDDIDVIITGRNGDKKNDEIYNELERSFFTNKQVVNYKHLCGEYPTASSFALWMASVIIKDGSIPKALSDQPQSLPE
jgi:3-oxoacyl-(acyl-carrier-protein) synthase